MNEKEYQRELAEEKWLDKFGWERNYCGTCESFHFNDYGYCERRDVNKKEPEEHDTACPCYWPEEV